MGKGKALSEEEEAVVGTLFEEGHTERYIAHKTGRSCCAIHNCIKRIQLGVKIHRPGKPRGYDERDVRRIIKHVSNVATSAKKVKAALQLDISPRTIQSIIRKSECIRPKKKSKKPVLKATEKAHRVD